MWTGTVSSRYAITLLRIYLIYIPLDHLSVDTYIDLALLLNGEIDIGKLNVGNVNREIKLYRNKCLSWRNIYIYYQKIMSSWYSRTAADFKRHGCEFETLSWEWLYLNNFQSFWSIKTRCGVEFLQSTKRRIDKNWTCCL